jgi:cytochrome b involved in lipid metabolism
MAVVSVRFNSKEEKILRTLKEYFNCDSSNLIKRSLLELYEEIHDREIIEKFEVKEDASKTKFIKIDDILNP